MTPVPKVLLIGFGAIGRQLVTLFDPGEFDVSAYVRDVGPHIARGTQGISLYDDHLPDLIGKADIVVECAGVAAAKTFGPEVIAGGKDLVLTSVGALAEPAARRVLLFGPGKLHVTSGAIGGFDLWAAVAEAGGADIVKIRTRKQAEALVQPWMSDSEKARLENATEPFVVFEGSPIDAIAKYPGNVNVSVALAWATRGRGDSDDVLLEKSLNRVHVELVADPHAERSRHDIEVSGLAGKFSLTSESAPSPVNPKTSGLTALSVAHSLRQAIKLL
ncbi:aspartate dehydrogenase domain-containing protein [Corynebacterium sp. S7]